jgi:hypothetical protein
VIDPIEKKWQGSRKLFGRKIQHMIIFYAISFGVIMFSMGALFTHLLQRMTVVKNEGLVFLENVDIIMAGLLVLIYALWIYIGLIISNKVVVPIFRIIGEIDKIKGGQKILKIALSKKDFFSDLTYAYNDVIEQLNNNKVVEQEEKQTADEGG